MKNAKQLADDIRMKLDTNVSGTTVANFANSLADIVVSPLKDISTCKRGCAHCCRQTSIMIDEVEAELLTKVTGRIAEIPQSSRSNSWKGIACVFLNPISNECGVYEHHPMVCRLSTSVDNPIKCETEELRQMVDLTSAYLEILKLVGKQHLAAYNRSRGKRKPSDIREFFPPAEMIS